MDWKQVIALVDNNSLLEHVKSIKSILINKRISLGIYGLADYFKYQKSLKRKDMQTDIKQKTNKKDKMYQDTSRISKKQLEVALTQVQLKCDCCYRLVDTPEELGMMVVQFTKSIAEAPYKLEKHEKQQEAEWYILGDNKDSVRVDKNGNGLQRLWQQIITTFPLARLEHAEAILATYPTPSMLLNDYAVLGESQGEKLLEDIPIRRAAGPLTTVRRIGPELSKKIYKFLTSTDENDVL